mmetsp:Transcript_8282/g.21401  ORF Transcript_8282/g.21401 Transcript_8282/m.21401 type:complete len:293 (-) Transcript_8282:140-1018(-)
MPVALGLDRDPSWRPLHVQQARDEAAHPNMTVHLPVRVVVDGLGLGRLLHRLIYEVLCPVDNRRHAPLPVVPLVVRVLEVITAEDHDGGERVNALLGAQLAPRLPGAVDRGEPDDHAVVVDLLHLARGLVPHGLQLLAPVTPGCEEVDDEHIVPAPDVLEVVDIDLEGTVELLVLQGRHVVGVLDGVFPLLKGANLLARLVQHHLRHAGGEPGIVCPHEIRRVHGRVLAREVRKGYVEVDLQRVLRAVLRVVAHRAAVVVENHVGLRLDRPVFGDLGGNEVHHEEADEDGQD